MFGRSITKILHFILIKYEHLRQLQASTLTYFSTCPFGQLTKKSTCPNQSFSCPKKLIKITKTKLSRAPTTFKLEVEVTSLSESSQGEVGYNKEKWGDFWEKSIAINQNIVSQPSLTLPCPNLVNS